MADYEDTEQFSFYDFHYVATKAEANAITLLVEAEPDHTRFIALGKALDRFYQEGPKDWAFLLDRATEWALLRKRMTILVREAHAKVLGVRR